MKCLKRKYAFFVMSYLKMITLTCMIFHLFSVQQLFATEQTISFTIDNLTITATWDDFACQGSTKTVIYNIKSTGAQSSLNYSFEGFTPITTGFACQSIIPPVPESYISFDGFAEPQGAGFNFCSSCGDNRGVWKLADPFPTLAGGFEMRVSFTLTECGIISFQPCIRFFNGITTQRECLGDVPITFFVAPYVQLTDVVTGPICQGIGSLTGLLPGPICTAQQGFTCPNCIPCTACSGFSGSTAATACTACSGISGCLCPCTACDGYTGCPACTSCLPCPGCVACASFSGPCGPQPYFYTVSNPTGGSVTLLDQTGGLYEFTLDPVFFGTASFNYNIVSDFQPLVFCSATAPGTVSFGIKQPPSTNDSNFVVCAGQNITGNLGNFVSGPTGAIFSFTLDNTTCTGFTLNPSGIFSFTAPTGPGSCTFDYTVTDLTPPPCSDTGFGTVTILEAPAPFDQDLTTCINTPVDGTLVATGGTAPYTYAVTSSTNGTAVINDAAAGTFTFTPDPGFTGVANFTFSVTDANGCSSLTDGTVTITVNTPVIPGTGAFSGCQGTNFDGTLTGLISGGTGPYVFGSVPPTVGGIVNVNTNGTFTFFPNFNFTGPASFNFAVTGDSCPASGIGRVTINFSPAPQVTGSRFDVCPGVTVTGDLNNNLLSLSGANISFTSVGAPSNGFLTLDPSGPYSFTPTPPTFFGAAGFNFQALDANLTCPSNVARIDVTVHPKPTVNTGVFAVCDNSSLNGNLNPLVQGEAPFTFVQDGAPVGGNLSLNNFGAFTFTPTVFGPAAGGFNYIVSSSFGCTSPGAVNITINPSPTATTGANIACGGVPVTGTLVPLVSGGTPAYFFNIVSQTNGVASVGALNGIYTFTPNNGVTGGSFVYRVSDQNSCSATSSVNISVNPGPQASNGAFTACLGVASFQGSLTGLVTGGSGTLTYSQTGPLPTCGTVIVNPDGTFTFNPNPGFVGSCNFQFQVTDTGTPSCFDVATVTFTVDEAPFASGATFNSCQDTLFTGNLNGFVSGGFPPFNFFQTGASPVCGTVNLATGGTFTFQPAPAFVGPCTFNWYVVDSTPCISNVADATVIVHPTPVAADTGPVGVTGPNNVCENTKASGNLNDLMSVGTPPYTFNAFNAINGSVSLNPVGPYTFNPIANFTGAASFQFRGRDSFGCLSNTGTVNINVNDAPNLTAQDPVFTCQNTPVTNQVFATGGTPPYVFSVVTVTHGTCVIDPVTGIYTFTPDFNFVGTAQIVFEVDDSLGCSARITVSVIVEPAPQVSSTSVQSCQQTVFGSLTGLVSGGNPPFTFSQTGTITCGDVTVNPNGTFVYTGPAGFTGPCTFDFTVTDNTASQCFATGSVTISQTATGAPVAGDGFFCACFNTPVSGNLSNFVSGGIPPYVYMVVGTPVGGTVIINPLTGFFIFKPALGFTGFASFQFIAKDSSNIFCQSNIGTITIQVPCCPFTGLTAPTGIIPG